MTAIYHITHIRNLAGILRDGGLWCDMESVKREISPVEIAYTDIKERRKRKVVPVAVRGVLADYVPFYFCPRSPMLYVIHKRYVPAYKGGQEFILHLTGSAEMVAVARLPFAFTDGHATMAISRYFDDLCYLNQVDWPVVNSWSWHDTLQDNDRERRKQAEFLVHRFFPWEQVQEIGVINQKVKDSALEIVANAAHQPIVNIQRKWYYD
jgi:hypothetical protein